MWRAAVSFVPAVCRRGLWSTVIVLAVGLGSGCATCATDLFLLPAKRDFNRMKNRTTLPSAHDIDPFVTLAAMVAPGHDRARWQPTRAAAIEGYVVRVHDTRPESANCFSPTRLDAHIEIAISPDAAPRQRLVVEVTPPMREWARRQGKDWSTPALQRTLTGRFVRITGWLLFDDEHDEESENTRPGHRDNWRATAWELHPVTAIEVPTQ